MDKINTACLFHDVNQGDEKITRMMCTIYFGFINAKYNGVIKNFTEEEIKKVADRQLKAGKWSETAGGVLADGIGAVQKYIKEDLKLPCNLVSTADDKVVLDWINRGFAVGIGIKVNKKFLDDKKDGKLDELDYKSYKGDIGHATNIMKFNCRGGECADKGKEYFLDSYFTTDSTYSCNIKEVLEDIDLINKFVLY